MWRWLGAGVKLEPCHYSEAAQQCHGHDEREAKARCAVGGADAIRLRCHTRHRPSHWVGDASVSIDAFSTADTAHSCVARSTGTGTLDVLSFALSARECP